jgi:hypothetical protein
MTSIGITIVNRISATAWPLSSRRIDRCPRTKRRPAPSRSRHGWCSTSTSGSPAVEEGGREPDARDEQARERRPADGGHREADVQQRVALLEQAGRLEHGADRSAGQPAPRYGERAVDEREQQHERQHERLVGEHRQRHEHDGLAEVDRREAAAQRHLVEPRGERGREQRGQELAHDEERRGGRDVLRPVVHEDGERDDAHGVAQLVQRVRREQATERPYPQRCKAPPHLPDPSRKARRGTLGGSTTSAISAQT